MTQAFRDMCLELADEPEKLAKFIRLYYDGEYVEPRVCRTCRTQIDPDDGDYCEEGDLS